MSDLIDMLRDPRFDGPLNASALAEIERLTADREQGGKDYLALMDRHDALFVELAAEREKRGRLEKALRWFDKHESTIKSDINSAHHGRSDAASDRMREDDRDFRRELCEAFARARAALGYTE
jgi:hypothetical protein